MTLKYLKPNIPELSNLSLLVVDDNATNRRIIERQCQNWGIHCQALNSGIQALELINQKQRFDVAIIDLHMPEKNKFIHNYKKNSPHSVQHFSKNGNINLFLVDTKINKINYG